MMGQVMIEDRFRGFTMEKHAAILERYLRVRKVVSAIQNAAVGSIPEDIFEKGAKELGLAKGKTLVMRAESEFAIFADHCIYDVLRNGKNVIERYMDGLTAAPDSDEAAIHQAIRNARYTFLKAERRLPGVGLEAQDVLYRQKLLLTDVGFSKSVQPGMWIATRLLVFDDFAMTTGAALPIAVLDERDARKMIDEFDRGSPEDFGALSRESRSQLATVFVRMALAMGVSENVLYGERGAMPLPVAASHKISRNEPCPCGSGKKYKRCCGR